MFNSKAKICKRNLATLKQKVQENHTIPLLNRTFDEKLIRQSQQLNDQKIISPIYVNLLNNSQQINYCCKKLFNRRELSDLSLQDKFCP